MPFGLELVGWDTGFDGVFEDVRAIGREGVEDDVAGRCECCSSPRLVDSLALMLA